MYRRLALQLFFASASQKFLLSYLPSPSISKEVKDDKLYDSPAPQYGITRVDWHYFLCKYIS